MKSILILLTIIFIAALGFDDYLKHSSLAEMQLQLLRVTQECDAIRQERIPVQQPINSTPWEIPRTITTRNGQVFRSATILKVLPDGGVVINYGQNAIKIPNGSLDEKTIQEILAAKPIPEREKQIAEPIRRNPLDSMSRIGGG